MSTSIVTVNSAATQTGERATSIREAADRLSGQSRDLTEEVDRFLKSIAAA